MNARLYDAKVHRFLAPDNYIQDPYNTQNYNRYGYVLNNPLRYTDPSGEIHLLVLGLIGAAIAVTTNGINNSINGDPFFQNAGLAAVTGFLTGIMSGVIGGYAMNIAGRAFSHSALGAIGNGFMGGDVGSGFLSGGIASLSASVFNGIINFKNPFLQKIGMSIAGASTGGVFSKLSGGKFWDGFRNGLISAGLNHAAHFVAGAIERGITINKVLRELHLKANDVPNKNNEATMSLVKESKGLSKWYKKGGIKAIEWEYTGEKHIAGYVNDHVFLNGNRIHTNYTMVSSLFHEFRHGWQYQSGFVSSLRKAGFGSYRSKEVTFYLMEIDAHSFQFSLGDNSANTLWAINHYAYGLRNLNN